MATWLLQFQPSRFPLEEKRSLLSVCVFFFFFNPVQKPSQSPSTYIPLTTDWPELSLVHFLATHCQGKWGYHYGYNETLDCEEEDSINKKKGRDD